MVDYVKFRAKAKTKFDENGRLVTFTKSSRVPNDSTKPWDENRTRKETLNTICLFTEYEIKEIDGDKVQVGDQKMFANAIDNGEMVMQDFDTVLDDGIEWRVKSVKPLKPGNLIIMYEIQVRK